MRKLGEWQRCSGEDLPGAGVTNSRVQRSHVQINDG